MADADIKAEMKKAMLELQSLANELNSALDRTSAKIEANDLIGSGLKDLYERVNARARGARRCFGSLPSQLWEERTQRGLLS